MTRRDYNLIASAFRDAQDGNILSVATKLAEYLKDDNPIFNTEKFLKACGLTD